MYLTGFTDEAGHPIETQIKVVQELGWNHMECRNVKVGDEKSANLHDIPDRAFDQVAAMLEEANIKVNCFGSAIANGQKNIKDPFEITLGEVKRSIPRMQKLGTKMIRIMSYPKLPEGEDQLEKERFHRLREIQKMFADAGLQAVHENCHNYGSTSWKHTLNLLENVPGLKLVFDTGNCLDEDDRLNPETSKKQCSWEFYKNVKDHVIYIHIKDGIFDTQTNKIRWTFAGEGQGNIPRILTDLLGSGYTGGISIEPHLKPLGHESAEEASRARYESFVKYGRIIEKIVSESLKQLPAFAAT